MANNCIIYIKVSDISKWNNYMYKLRTSTPELPPAFRTDKLPAPDIEIGVSWIQMLMDIDDIARIYDLMDEYAMMTENYNENQNTI